MTFEQALTCKILYRSNFIGCLRRDRWRVKLNENMLLWWFVLISSWYIMDLHHFKRSESASHHLFIAKISINAFTQILIRKYKIWQKNKYINFTLNFVGANSCSDIKVCVDDRYALKNWRIIKAFFVFHEFVKWYYAFE